MDRKLVEFQGKMYPDISEDSQRVLAIVNVYTFRFFAKDRVWMASDLFAENFGVKKFYKVLPDKSGGPEFVYPSEQDRNVSLYTRALNGEPFVSDTFRSYDGDKYYKLTIAVSEWDKEGKPAVLAGIAQNFDDNMLKMKVLQTLSENYGSAYLVDFDKDTVTTFSMTDVVKDVYGDELKVLNTYRGMMDKYIDSVLAEEDRDNMRRTTSYENLSIELSDKNVFVYDYHIVRDGVRQEFRMKAVKADDSPHLSKMVVGFTDVSVEKDAQMKRLAFHDHITNGNNFNYFTVRLKEENKCGYMISFDLKAFKIVNSVCGIGKGDYVLARISEILEEVIGGKGFFGHVNADHFVIFCPFNKDEEVVELLDSITKKIDQLVKEINIPKVTPYFGVTYWTPDGRVQVSFSEANAAKHRIKDLKNINYGFYRDEDTAAAIEEKEIENAFDMAIKEKQFEIWYQPKYNPSVNKLTGAEALIRWRKPDGNLVSPGKFIPVFEKNGMIKQLDEYVFRGVCAQQKQWIDEEGKTVPVSINLSRASLYYDNLVEEYKAIADDIGILPELVPIEITESAAIDNADIKNLADKFFNAGFPLHIDDFGTGYSSLSTLNLMRFDTLKLDKSLIDYIGEFGGDRLIKHTVALAKDLGLHITAEGVEKEEQVDFLKKLNCDNIQGFFFSRPMPADFFVEKLRNDGISDRYLYKKGQRYTYSGVVESFRRASSSVNLKSVEGHAAVQINITGEGEGAFYIEFGKGIAEVQPYEYYDRDALVTSSAEVLLEILHAKKSIEGAYREGKIKVEGDPGAAMLVKQLVCYENDI